MLAYDYNQAPVKVYSVCSYDVSNGIEYSITDAEGRPLFFPTTIKLGDELNLDGMKICIKSLDKKEFVDLERSMISGYDSSAKGEEALGKKTIIVTYEGKEIYTATILVSDKVESFTLIKPEKTEYTVNSVKKLDLTGCAADVKYVSGKEEKGYKITANMVDASDVDFTKAGTYEVKVVIDGVTQTFEVVIKSAAAVPVRLPITARYCCCLSLSAPYCFLEKTKSGITAYKHRGKGVSITMVGGR